MKLSSSSQMPKTTTTKIIIILKFNFYRYIIIIFYLLHRGRCLQEPGEVPVRFRADMQQLHEVQPTGHSLLQDGQGKSTRLVIPIRTFLSNYLRHSF